MKDERMSWKDQVALASRRSILFGGVGLGSVALAQLLGIGQQVLHVAGQLQLLDPLRDRRVRRGLELGPGRLDDDRAPGRAGCGWLGPAGPR